MNDLAETAVQFGDDDHLTGILLVPPSASANSVACLMLNVGVTHRIGPRRMNVKFARALAGMGVPSLRFDLSGIGDSAAAAGRSNFREQTLLDMKAAMDHVQATTGISRFAVLGVCSGAVNGYWLAQADARVVGLMMFDGFTYATSKTQVVHDWARLRTTPWRKAVDKVFTRVKRLFGQGSTAAVSIFNAAPEAVRPTRAEFRQAMDALAARGVALQLVFSGSLLIEYNYHGQLKDAFGNARFMERLDYHYLPDVDHLATPLAAQRKLIDIVCAWVGSFDATAHRPSAVSADAPRLVVAL